MPARRHLRRLALAAGAAAAALLIAEGALRVLDLPRVDFRFLGGETDDLEMFRLDPELFWLLRPGNRDYRANRHGLRGPWPPGHKQGADLRIVCVGDSCTFGSGVELGETYGQRLALTLQSDFPGLAIETCHLALPGYSTYQNRILIDRHVDELQPDVAVLYCGVWNDFGPAVGGSDRELIQRAGEPHVVRLLRRVRTPEVSPDAIRAEYREGRTPFGRRVPVDEFLENMHAIVTRLRSIRCVVVAVVPPTPQKTLEQFPIAGEYREALRDFAAQNDVPLLDAQAAFSAFAEATPEAWRVAEHGYPLTFVDWIHPSPIGHHLISELLREHLHAVVQAHAEEATRPLGAAAPGRIVAEPTIRALHGSRHDLQLAWRAESPAVAVRRVWLGGEPLSDDEFDVGPGAIRFRLPDRLPPGPYPVRVVTSQGLVPEGPTLVVDARPTQATLEAEGAALVLHVSIEGPPGAYAAMWISDRLRTEPELTRYGPFLLAGGDPGRPVDRPELPFRFEFLTLPGSTFRIDESGTGHLAHRIEVPPEQRPEAIYVQGGVRVRSSSQDRGWLLAPTRISVPR